MQPMSSTLDCQLAITVLVPGAGSRSYVEYSKCCTVLVSYWVSGIHIYVYTEMKWSEQVEYSSYIKIAISVVVMKSVSDDEERKYSSTV